MCCFDCDHGYCRGCGYACKLNKQHAKDMAKGCPMRWPLSLRYGLLILIPAWWLTLLVLLCWWRWPTFDKELGPLIENPGVVYATLAVQGSLTLLELPMLWWWIKSGKPAKTPNSFDHCCTWRGFWYFCWFMLCLAQVFAGAELFAFSGNSWVGAVQSWKCALLFILATGPLVTAITVLVLWCLYLVQSWCYFVRREKACQMCCGPCCEALCHVEEGEEGEPPLPEPPLPALVKKTPDQASHQASSSTVTVTVAPAPAPTPATKPITIVTPTPSTPSISVSIGKLALDDAHAAAIGAPTTLINAIDAIETPTNATKLHWAPVVASIVSAPVSCSSTFV